MSNTYSVYIVYGQDEKPLIGTMRTTPAEAKKVGSAMMNNRPWKSLHRIGFRCIKKRISLHEGEIK